MKAYEDLGRAPVPMARGARSHSLVNAMMWVQQARLKKTVGHWPIYDAGPRKGAVARGYRNHSRCSLAGLRVGRGSATDSTLSCEGPGLCDGVAWTDGLPSKSGVKLLILMWAWARAGTARGSSSHRIS